MILIKIPEERKPVLIGKDGRTKSTIESATKTEISIGSEIAISGEAEKEIKAGDIVKAIGRGFPPEIAMKLLDEDQLFDLITLKGSPNTIKRILARIIGTQGKARKNIEKLTGSSVAVYGKTVSMIGSYKEVDNARKAIELLIVGRMHASVWRQLERTHTKKESAMEVVLEE